jgi:hypothetical protein
MATIEPATGGGLTMSFCRDQRRTRPSMAIESVRDACEHVFVAIAALAFENLAYVKWLGNP